MKLTLKILTFTLLLSLATGTGYAISEGFKDQNEIPSWAQNSIKKLTKTGVINGYEDGNFGPHDYVTRAQLATVLDRQNAISNKKSLEIAGGLLMRYRHLEDTELSHEVQTVLALAMEKFLPTDQPSESTDDFNGYMSDCYLKNQNGTLKVKSSTSPLNLNLEGVPQSYNVYLCHGYGTYYLVHHNYTGFVLSSTEEVTINEWYGPYYQDILISK